MEKKERIIKKIRDTFITVLLHAYYSYYLKLFKNKTRQKQDYKKPVLSSNAQGISKSSGLKLKQGIFCSKKISTALVTL